jgi:hypothetical protein
MIKEINVPFLQCFRRDVTTGQKLVSTRHKKLGKPLDYFWVDDGTGIQSKCVLLAVFKLPLYQVAFKFYRAEGFASFEEFVKSWNKIYPEYRYETYNQCNFWVHIFTPAHQWAGYEPYFERTIQRSTAMDGDIKRALKEMEVLP